MSIDTNLEKEDALEHYPAVRKNDILPAATTWKDLDAVTLSGISQSQKDKYRHTSEPPWVEAQITPERLSQFSES